MTEQDLRLLAAWAEECALHVLPLFEAKAPKDTRPREALAALRGFARGEKRTARLRTHVSATLAAAREVGDPSARAAARAVAVATGIAYTHANVTAQQVRHVLGPVAYAAQAQALADDDPDAAEQAISRAVAKASPALRALVRRMPMYRPGRGAFDALLGRVNAALRKRAPRRMTLAEVERRCAAKPDTVLTTPFGPRPHVYKTAGKMFALCGHLDDAEVISLKCDPERSSTLRLTFPAITAGYHLHKLHWNTIRLDGTVPASLIRELVDHAHEVIQAAARTTRGPKPARARRPKRRRKW
ncbi:MAG: MmcQ/YjbR family DNA-binding protein [Kofleriaceae bacterium]|nr:MmcQ/YjbR family DNA-binding protein [Kofleriaceae bacterium]